MNILLGLKSQAKWKLPKEVNNFMIEALINNHGLSLLDISCLNCHQKFPF